MTKTKSFIFAAVSAVALAACGGADGGSRDSIRAVGSSTVFPFAKAVSESFVRTHPDFRSPIIEATGTGGGMKLFCAGLGASTPDMTHASRRMKASEFAGCQANGVTDIIEVQVGLDGIAFASAKNGITMNLTPKIVYEALAASPYGKPQTAKTWSDVDPSLPDLPILVYGPPSTSGTRDALKELVLEAGCETDPNMEALKETDKDRFGQLCTEVRSDGAYVDQGEQDNLIVQKIEGNPNAVGIFGYSYLEENSNKVQGLHMNGVAPTYENISSFEYPGARPLYVYVKKAHLDAIPGLKQYLAEWTKMWAKDGDLAKIGLVASPDDVMAVNQKAATEFTTLDGAQLK
ncbi:phosphate ABC transporter substrate-binding protein [Erythrobacter sp. SAORIC-644]|uniref:substrate-binding domain-containing protein n=1 Tax=Erythrobacter sp. SAORIC-644 TaxID=1869314 RepID=UPI000C9F2E97|nr:substrate-binding domain-containing protein [Erythrobacter sp. SAORIC-644]PNQ76917.1 phosphate ABC transporter substrate-binding protein [Erythrobacter sp. SAORIC-644]